MKLGSLQMRLIVWFGLCLLITIGALVVYSVISGGETVAFAMASSKKSAVAAAEEQLRGKAKAIALEIDAGLEDALDLARTRWLTYLPVSKIPLSI